MTDRLKIFLNESHKPSGQSAFTIIHKRIRWLKPQSSGSLSSSCWMTISTFNIIGKQFSIFFITDALFLTLQTPAVIDTKENLETLITRNKRCNTFTLRESHVFFKLLVGLAFINTICWYLWLRQKQLNFSLEKGGPLAMHYVEQWFPTFFISRPHSKIWHSRSAPAINCNLNGVQKAIDKIKNT